VSQVVKGLDNFLLIEGGWTRVTAPSYPTTCATTAKLHRRARSSSMAQRAMNNHAIYVCIADDIAVLNAPIAAISRNYPSCFADV
jgi:hypothetical protein